MPSFLLPPGETGGETGHPSEPIPPLPPAPPRRPAAADLPARDSSQFPLSVPLPPVCL